jgi:hypothetical protein
MGKINILDEKKRWGVGILLGWAVGEYKSTNEEHWVHRINFLVKLQRKTHYNKKEKIIYNRLRDEFLSKKNQEST